VRAIPARGSRLVRRETAIVGRAPRRRSCAGVAKFPARLAIALLTASASAVAQPDDAMDAAFEGLAPVAHLRTYFWNGQSTKGDPSEAWAAGGWAGFTTRWYGDILQLGILGYTSQKLYGPVNKDGSQLLAPGQAPINVLGQAYLSLRAVGQTFTGYRQLIDQPWVNPQDSRMVPNLFEGYLLSGKAAEFDYVGGYVTKFKARDANSFVWMSSATGATGPQQGMVLLGARVPLPGPAGMRIAEQYLVDTYNTAYADGDYPVAFGSEGRLRLKGQYANQQSVGSAGLGAFNTWMYGIEGVYERGPFGVEVAWTRTSRNRATLAPFGANPSYLNLMQVAFNAAGEKAWLLGGTCDFSTLGAPGFTASVTYGNGRGAISSTTGAPSGSRNETDVQLAYATARSSALPGLSFGLEGSWLNQAGAAAQGRQLRVFANYEIPFNGP
jgi:hypothetical protein